MIVALPEQLPINPSPNQADPISFLHPSIGSISITYQELGPKLCMLPPGEALACSGKHMYRVWPFSLLQVRRAPSMLDIYTYLHSIACLPCSWDHLTPDP